MSGTHVFRYEYAKLIELHLVSSVLLEEINQNYQSIFGHLLLLSFDEDMDLTF